MRRKILVDVSELTLKKMMYKKEMDGFGDKTLGEYLDYVFRDVRLQPTEGEMISLATKENLFQLWMDNFAENLPYIRKGNTLDKLVPPEPDKAPKGWGIVVGAGPSVRKYRQLETLAESDFDGVVIATDSMLVRCLENGIVPDFVVSVDGAEIIADFYRHELVKKFGSQIKALLISTVHPKVREALEEAGAQIYWFHGLFDDWRSPESFTRLVQTITKTKDKPHGLATVSCLGNTGAASWVVCHSLLRRNAALIGIDMGYPEGYPLTETYYFSTYLKAAGGDPQKALAFGYREVYNPFTKCKVVQDPVFRHYTEAWLEAARMTPSWHVTVNCSPESALFSFDGTINTMRFEDFLKYYRDLEELKRHFLKAE